MLYAGNLNDRVSYQKASDQRTFQRYTMEREDVPVNNSGKLVSFFFRALVETSQILGFLLEVVEYTVGVGVPAWHCSGPQFLHKEHLVGQVGHGSCVQARKISPVRCFTLSKISQILTMSIKLMSLHAKSPEHQRHWGFDHGSSNFFARGPHKLLHNS